jgi:hypothetical protein
MLTFGEFAQRWQKHRDVTFLLSFDDGCRVLAGGRQMRTVIGAVNFDQSFSRAADGADRLSQGRARTARLPLITDWTCHAPASHTSPRVGNLRTRRNNRAICAHNPSEIRENSQEYGLQPAVMRHWPGSVRRSWHVRSKE